MYYIYIYIYIPERSLSFFKELQGADLTPDVISFSVAISACEKVGQWEQEPQRSRACRVATEDEG